MNQSEIRVIIFICFVSPDILHADHENYTVFVIILLWRLFSLSFDFGCFEGITCLRSGKRPVIINYSTHTCIVVDQLNRNQVACVAACVWRVHYVTGFGCRWLVCRHDFIIWRKKKRKKPKKRKPNLVDTNTHANGTIWCLNSSPWRLCRNLASRLPYKEKPLRRRRRHRS